MKERIRIAICEDDQAEREYIRSLVLAWGEEKEKSCRVDDYASAEQLIFSFDNEFPYSIYLLDIQMGQVSGMELARKIREKDKTAVIVFLTGLKDYALEGYEVGALRYLIKPVREEELFALLSRATEELATRQEQFFVLEQGSEVLKISYEDIWYLESSGHYIELYYDNQKIQWKASLGSVQKEFEQNGFVMTRRGTLLNLRKIAKVGRTECILDNGKCVAVSRSQYKKVNEAFIEYYRHRN